MMTIIIMWFVLLAVAEVEDTREILNVVFIGHVDAGKSTIGGQIMLESNHLICLETLIKHPQVLDGYGRQTHFGEIRTRSEREKSRVMVLVLGS